MLTIDYKKVFVLFCLSLVFFMVGNNILSLTNPDEVFYTQTAKEMAFKNTWAVPYLFDQPQFEKPILTYWLLRIGFIFFGVSNFGARFFPAIFALIGVIATYIIALYGYKDQKKAFFCSIVLMSSALYIGLARTVFTDMIFSVFISLALGSFFLAYIMRIRQQTGIILFYVFSALAVLTKGPLGLIVPLTVVLIFLASQNRLKFLFSRYSLLGLFIFCLIALPWYIFIIKRYGSSFINEFFYNDHIRRLIIAEHRGNDRWYFYPFSAVLCMFPWSVYLVVAFYYLIKNSKKNSSQPIYLFLASWIGGVFIIFQAAHSKLVSYIFPLFPAMAILTGDFIYSRIISGNKKFISMPFYISWAIFLILPIVAYFVAAKHSIYLPSKLFLYNFIFIYAGLTALMLFFAFKRKLLINMCLLAVCTPILLFFVLSLHENLDPYVSSKSACEYLLKNNDVKNTILCSKMLVRGVRFYTDKDVAVINATSSSFYSPHPIVYLDSDAKIKAFLKKQSLTYCIVSKSAYKSLQRISENEFEVDLLKVMGNEYIVKIN